MSIQDMNPETAKANLGMATTAELIAELHARAQVSATVGEHWPTYRTVDHQEDSAEADEAETGGINPNVGRTIQVCVTGHWVKVTVGKEHSLTAVATGARWKVGQREGALPVDNWDIRDGNGRLLTPDWPVSELFPNPIYVNLKPGVGA